MRKLGSHGRLNLIVFFCVLAPLFVALGAGFRAIRNISQVPREKLDALRVEEVTSQAKMLTESLWSATDSIRSRAFAIYQTQISSHQAEKRDRKVQNLPEGPILYLSILEMKEDGKWNLSETLKKPGFTPGETFEAGYFKALTENVNLLETQRRGVGLVRVPRIEGERNLPVVLTFPLGPSGVLAALVYPMEAFPVFEKWRTHSAGGMLRAYLVGKDGVLLTHSIASYVGSKIDTLSLFKQSLQPLFAGERISGAGTYASMDQLQTTLSYTRLGQMDLGVVVEKVLSEESSPLPWLELLAAGLLSTGVALLLAYGLSAWLMKQVPVAQQRTIRRAVDSQKSGAKAAAWIQPQKTANPGAQSWVDSDGSERSLESQLPVIGGNSGKRKYDPSLNQ